ncbi:TetR/AcrR family transcriptional regulator [Nocardia sp. NPDC055049]
MTRAATGIYRGTSAEQRRDERRQRLMDAALDIIGTQGWAATTVRGVCEQAKVGPRFFYESFDDLDALAAAVHDEIVDTAIRSSLDALAAAPEDIAAKTRAAVTAILNSVVDDPRRARIAFAEAHGSEILMRRRAAAMRTIADVVAEQERALLDPPAGSETLVSAVSLMITGGAAELVLAWLDGGMDISRDELINLCVEFVLTFADNLTTMAARLAH